MKSRTPKKFVNSLVGGIPAGMFCISTQSFIFSMMSFICIKLWAFKQELCRGEKRKKEKNLEPSILLSWKIPHIYILLMGPPIFFPTFILLNSDRPIFFPKGRIEPSVFPGYYSPPSMPCLLLLPRSSSQSPCETEECGCS